MITKWVEQDGCKAGAGGGEGRASSRVSSFMGGGVARSWTVPSPPPGACGARFGAEVESEHPPGGSPLLAGAEGVQCNQSRAESPPRTPPITML